MQKEFLTYAKELLPTGFRYPEKYLQFSVGIDFPEEIDWWFISSNTESGKLGWSLRNIYIEWKNIGNRNLIPFAKLNDYAAFFDGDNITGDPSVIMIDLGNKQHTLEVENFDAWLKIALEN